MSKFIQKEKYNVSSRAIDLSDIDKLNEYQKSLFDFILYTPRLSAKVKKSIKIEIQSVEIFISNYFETTFKK